MAVASSSQTPLPFTQIAVLMGVRLAEPISYTVIFPFINQMVEELGITDNPDKVGFYSGLVESVFAFVQFFTVYHWAKLSDRIGRKPVIIIGLLGVAVSGAFFGLSTNFWMMICIRSISGALNGNVATVKAAIGDITDETNSTEAFAMYGLTWTVGSIIGNALGGTLSHPCERFPQWFGDFDLLRRYPYLLPCLVSTIITFVGILFAWVFYDESLPSRQIPTDAPMNMRLLPSTPRQSTSSRYTMATLKDGSAYASEEEHALRRGRQRHSSSLSMSSDADTLVGSPTAKEGDKSCAVFDDIDEMGLGDEDDLVSASEHDKLAPYRRHSADDGFGQRKEWGFWDLMRYRPVQILCMTMFANQFISGAWGAVSLLFFFDRKGGLSMSTSAIGFALSANGFWTIICQLLLLNRIRRWLGISTAYKVLSFGWILVFILLPLLRNLLEMTETPSSTDGGVLRFGEERGWPVRVGVNGVLSFVTVVMMANSLLMVLINFSSPDKTALGAVNGIATAVSCMSRVLGPSAVSALFAVSMDTLVLGGRLWWIFMCIMSAVNFGIALCVPADQGRPRAPALSEEEVRAESGGR